MKKIIWMGAIVLSMLLVSCGGMSASEVVDVKKQQTGIPLISNMTDEVSRKEVGDALKRFLNAENVERFLQVVKDYNDTVENTGLRGPFEPKESAEYDEAAMQELWNAKKGDFIGTNCRLNVFMLMKDNLEISKKEADSVLLFMDKDAIQTGKLFGEQEAQRFQQLFSRVKTENTKDIRIHAKKMEEFFSDITFNENVRMLSVVIHDHLDGDFLFIGHVAVLTEQNGTYLLVEKLSFSEPYQAVKFPSREDCYRYLYKKYEHYSDETTAKPFIMDNGDLAGPELHGAI